MILVFPKTNDKYDLKKLILCVTKMIEHSELPYPQHKSNMVILILYFGSTEWRALFYEIYINFLLLVLIGVIIQFTFFFCLYIELH